MIRGNYFGEFIVSLETGLDAGKTPYAIAQELGRPPKTVMREIRGRTVVEAVAAAKRVAEAMDEYMRALPKDSAPDPFADIPVFDTVTSDVLGEQEILH